MGDGRGPRKGDSECGGLPSGRVKFPGWHTDAIGPCASAPAHARQEVALESCCTHGRGGGPLLLVVRMGKGQRML
jgi:hypothetical protein